MMKVEDSKVDESIEELHDHSRSLQTSSKFEHVSKSKDWNERAVKAHPRLLPPLCLYCPTKDVIAHGVGVNEE